MAVTVQQYLSFLTKPNHGHFPEDLGIIFGIAVGMRGSFLSPVWNCGATRPGSDLRSISMQVNPCLERIEKITLI